MGRPPGSRNKTETDTGTELTVIDQPTKSVLVDMSNRYGMEPAAFEATVRATCMRPDKNGHIPTREEFAAFLLVAKEYNLNPLTKEIYAYAGKGGGIVPIVSVDGWVNLVNSHGACDGFDFEMEHGEKNALISSTCRMYRKDRSHPVIVTEYLSECIRDTDPWKMKHRMLRHKSLIQAARYAFGFSGIYDEDEGAKIAEIEPTRDGPPRAVPTNDPKLIEITANPEADQPQDTEQARDGTPPPRATKAAPPKDDPISSGPPRTTAPPKDTGPSNPDHPTPYKIPGTGETFETWAAKFCDLIKTSPDSATAYKWIDLNNDPLGRLAKGKPSVSATVKKTTEKVMQAFKDAQEKTEAKAAKKAAPDMDDGPGDMSDGTDAEGPPDGDPESILKWAKAQLEGVADADNLETFYNDVIVPHTDQLFPPDQDLIAGYYRAAEKRLGID